MKIEHVLGAVWMLATAAATAFGLAAAQPDRVGQVRILPVCTYTLQERDGAGWITVKTWTRRCDAPSNSRGSTGIGACGRILEEVGP